MQDAILAGTGNSRILKTAPGALDRWPTHEALMRAFDEGSVLVDLLRNASGYAQLGTDLKKETLLQDSTAALVGLGAWATPNDMLASLAQNLNGKIELGTYVGTQTTNNSPHPPVQLNFTGTAKMFVIVSQARQANSQSTMTPGVIIGLANLGYAVQLHAVMGSGVNGQPLYSGAATLERLTATFATNYITVHLNQSYFNYAGSTYSYAVIK